MALTRKQKEKLLETYKDLLNKAKNIVVMQQEAIPVNEINKVRMAVKESGGKLQVVKKRLFLMALKAVNYEEINLDKLQGSIIVLYSLEDEFKPLKALHKIVKWWKKEKAPYKLEYLGGFYEMKWKDADYVREIAELPTKDELIGKFAFLIKFPVQSFVMNLKQIAEKKWEEKVS